MKEQVIKLDGEIQPVPTLWSGTDISEIPPGKLEGAWVLKPNHLSGGRVLRGREPSAIISAKPLVASWLKTKDVSDYLGEWAYSFARPMLLLEPHIGEPNMDPIDYKVFTFGATAVLIQVHISRFDDHSIFHFTPEWRLLAINKSDARGEVPEKPVHLKEMLRQASVIGAGFSFMRVDFYDTGDDLYFGEVTPYPASGFRRFIPRSFDIELGKLWQQPHFQYCGRATSPGLDVLERFIEE